MKPIRWCVMAAAGALLLLAAPASADVVRLRDGRVLEGRVVAEYQNLIVFEVTKYGVSAIMHLQRTDVISITPGATLPPVEPQGPIIGPDGASPPPPTTTAPDTGPAPAEASEAECLDALVRFRLTFPLPAKRPSRWDVLPDLVSDADSADFVNRFDKDYRAAWGHRADVSIAADRARVAMVNRLYAAANLPDLAERRGLARLCLLKAREMLGRVSLKVGDTPERLREAFVKRIDPDNPRHLAGLVGWDVREWSYAEQSQPGLLDARLDSIAANTVILVRWLIEYGQSLEAGAMASNVRGTFNSVNRRTPDDLNLAILAVRGLAMLAQRIVSAEAILNKDHTDEATRKQLALDLACYVQDVPTALMHLALVRDAKWQLLIDAGRTAPNPRALFLLGQGLLELARRPPSDRPEAFADPLPLRRAALFCLEDFIAANRGEPADTKAAQDWLKQLRSDVPMPTPRIAPPAEPPAQPRPEPQVPTPPATTQPEAP